MQPARIEACAAIPRLPSGKYDLEALRAGVVQGTASTAGVPAAR
jgi:hypothetical protein